MIFSLPNPVILLQHIDLRVDLDPETLLYVLLDGPGQLHHLTAGRSAVIDQHQRLAIMDPYRSLAPTLPATTVDQPSGRQFDMGGIDVVNRQIGIGMAQRLGHG